MQRFGPSILVAGVDVLIHEVAATDKDDLAKSSLSRSILAHHTTAPEAAAIFREAAPKLTKLARGSKRQWIAVVVRAIWVGGQTDHVAVALNWNAGLELLVVAERNQASGGRSE
jgi:hypothetical protein